MVRLCLLLILLAAPPAWAATYTVTTTAEQDAAIQAATDQFNASRSGRSPVTPAEYVSDYLGQMLGSLVIRVQHQQQRAKEATFDTLPLSERQRILNQMRCKKDTC